MAGNHFTGVNYLNQAIGAYPQNTNALMLPDNCQDRLDSVKDAISYYDRALQIDPGHARIWFNKVMSLKKIGQKNEAAACMERCMNLNFR